MIATAVQFYDVVTFFHIAAVVIAFGPTFAYGVFSAVAEREGGASFPTVGRAILIWNRTGTTLGMVLILLTGIYLVADGPFDLSTFFVSWGFVAILVLFGMVHGYFIPHTRRQVERAERDLAKPEGKLSPEFGVMSAQVARVGSLAGLIVILTIYVMTAKPFL
jgi:uncharacterized membrane protein YciS (DUF1049 family)